MYFNYLKKKYYKIIIKFGEKITYIFLAFHKFVSICNSRSLKIKPIPEPLASYFGFEVPFISTPLNASFCCPTSPLSKLLNGLWKRKYNIKQTCC